MLNNANLWFYVLAKQTLKDKFIEEFQDLWESILEIVEMIKALTYDKLAAIFGGGTVGIIFGMIVAITIMFILMKIINH